MWRSARGCRFALGAGCGWLLHRAPLPALAAAGDEGGCAVHVTPADASNEWRRAGLELRQRIRQWPAPDRDCRDFSIDVRNDGALLTITTKDGRRAQRSVATPSALVPAASALAVSVEAAPPPDPPPPARPPLENRDQEPQNDRAGLVFLGGGLRLGTPGAFLAPVIRTGAALRVDRWELGTFFDWAPHHWHSADPSPPQFRMWSMGSGLAIGRRAPLGALDLVAGLMFGASFVHQESTTQEIDDGEVEIDEEEGDGVDVQFGGYLGIVTPRRASVRLRTQIELAFPLARPGEPRELDGDLPRLPGWTVTAVVGAELGGP